MKRALFILIGGVLLACAGYCAFYFLGTASHRSLLASTTPELLWLKQEFNLGDAEFARIAQLHEAYLPQCKERCRRIAELNDKLAQLVTSGTQMTSEIEKLLAERGKMRADCQAEMLKHFFDVSRTMPPEQGKRYLAWVQRQTCLAEQTMNHGEMNHADAPAATHHE